MKNRLVHKEEAVGLLGFLSNIFGDESVASEPDATLDDIDSIYNVISEIDQDGAFVVFMPNEPRDGEKDVLNIQFSIENGKVGLDWVLISPINVLEKNRFIQVCQSRSTQVQEREENGCGFLRVEGGDLVALCKEAITALYPGLQGKSLDLVVEGFEWPRNV